ncbi:DUF2959 family protein [Thermodesulfobacteriota bacterium]
MSIRLRIVVSFLLLGVTGFMGCQKAYYSVWEKLGKEKRHLLKDHVEDARTEQEKASEQFKDVLSRIKEIYGFEGGDLEIFYKKLQSDYEGCENRANAVEKRIDRVRETALDLFSEWEAEIKEMSNEKFKADSSSALKETKQRYARLYESMTKAKSKMAPVLTQLKDYVLYLKHNLNARAIGALKKEMADIEFEVKQLVKDINTSIKEADDFLKTLE